MGFEPPKLSLCAALEASLQEEDSLPAQEAVVNLARERAKRGLGNSQQVTPEIVLQMALDDCKERGNVTKCYITLVMETEEAFSTSNYRSNMTRVEEIAFRQLGLQEQIDSWRSRE